MSYKLTLSVIVLASIALDSHAITNIESQRSRQEINGIKSQVEFAISGKSGNSDEESIEAALRIDYRQQQHQMLGILNFEREKTADVESSDNNFAHFRYIQHRSDTFAWEGYTQYQQDAFKSLDSRALVGAGTRFNISPENEDYLLTIGVGAYYTQEVYNLVEGTLDDDYMRGNAYASFFKTIANNITFSNTLYWQPRFSSPSDCYIYNNLGFKLAINSALSIQLTVESQFDSDPVEDVGRIDHNYSTSLLYQF